MDEGMSHLLLLSIPLFVFLGILIDITGMAVPAKEAENAKPTPPKADHYMKLSAIKMVSSTCP